jgi:hypothetical protein
VAMRRRESVRMAESCSDRGADARVFAEPS